MQHTKEVILGVGITLAIAIVAFSVLGGSTISQSQSESLEIESVELKKGSSGAALLSVKIKNAGNSALSTITGQLNFDTDSSTTAVDPFTFAFTPTTLEPGTVTVFVGEVTNSATMSMGESFTLFINGTTLQGIIIQDTGVASVGRF